MERRERSWHSMHGWHNLCNNSFFLEIHRKLDDFFPCLSWKMMRSTNSEKTGKKGKARKTCFWEELLMQIKPSNVSGLLSRNHVSTVSGRRPGYIVGVNNEWYSLFLSFVSETGDESGNKQVFLTNKTTWLKARHQRNEMRNYFLSCHHMLGFLFHSKSIPGLFLFSSSTTSSWHGRWTHTLN